MGSFGAPGHPYALPSLKITTLSGTVLIIVFSEARTTRALKSGLLSEIPKLSKEFFAPFFLLSAPKKFLLALQFELIVHLVVPIDSTCEDVSGDSLFGRPDGLFLALGIGIAGRMQLLLQYDILGRTFIYVRSRRACAYVGGVLNFGALQFFHFSRAFYKSQKITCLYLSRV